ncbi:pilus assembly protein [Roseovarius aestuarii]|nr:pilus assembly protein [Roseovarius aestuarii]
MTHKKTNILQDDDGAVAVEFVLVLPLLLSMVFGIICFGQYFAIANSLQQLAAEAARYSALGITSEEREALALSFVANTNERFSFLGPDKITPSISTLSEDVPDAIVVSLSYDLTGSAVDVASGFLGFEFDVLTRRSYLAY